MANLVVGSCHNCGKESYLECAPESNGPYMRVPATIDLTRNVTETAGPTACNELTGGVEQETCEGTTSTNWSVQGEECIADPICNYLVRGACKYFTVQHWPYNGFNRWSFMARIGALTGVSYNKTTTVGWAFNLAVQGQETKPVAF